MSRACAATLKICCSSIILCQICLHLQRDVVIPHLPFQLGLRDERGNRIHDDHVDRCRFDQGVDDVQSFKTKCTTKPPPPPHITATAGGCRTERQT